MFRIWLYDEVKVVVNNSPDVLYLVSLLALSAKFKAKFGPPIVKGFGGGMALSLKDTLKETSSAVCKAIVNESFNPICVGKGSYNFIKRVY